MQWDCLWRPSLSDQLLFARGVCCRRLDSMEVASGLRSLVSHTVGDSFFVPTNSKIWLLLYLSRQSTYNTLTEHLRGIRQHYVLILSHVMMIRLLAQLGRMTVAQRTTLVVVQLGRLLLGHHSAHRAASICV